MGVREAGSRGTGIILYVLFPCVWSWCVVSVVCLRCLVECGRISRTVVVPSLCVLCFLCVSNLLPYIAVPFLCVLCFLCVSNLLYG